MSDATSRHGCQVALPQSCFLQGAEVTRRVRRFRVFRWMDARARGSREHVLSRADSPNGVESRSGGEDAVEGALWWWGGVRV
jgi:hypothetical protein